MWRKITARAFTVNSYRNVMSASIHHFTKLFIRTLEAKAREGATIDLSAVLFALTLDTFTSISFSTDPGSLPAAARGETNAFAQAFDEIQVLLARRMSTCVASSSRPDLRKLTLTTPLPPAGRSSGSSSASTVRASALPMT